MKQARWACMAIHRNPPIGRVREFLKEYGNFAMAYSLLADDNISLAEIPGKGVVGYYEGKDFLLYVADPLCAKSDLTDVVEAIRVDSQNRDKKLAIIQADIDTAVEFANQGYNANQMGVETEINIQGFDTVGKKKAKLRRWLNASRKKGVCIHEDIVNAENTSIMKEVSNAWMQTKTNNQELDLLTRRPTYQNEEDTRVFFAEKDGAMCGFAVFDPIYYKGEVMGYYANIERINPEAPNGTLDLIVNEAREVFKTQGKKVLNLGLSPLSDIQDELGIHNKVFSQILKTFYEFGDSFYSFKGLDRHKMTYHDGENTIRAQTYFITKGTFPYKLLLDCFSTIGIVPKGSVVGRIAYIGSKLIPSMLGRKK